MQDYYGRNLSITDVSILANKKGQSNIIEYIFMTLFVIIMIVVLIIFMSWFQFSQIEMRGGSLRTEKAEFLMGYITASPYMVIENSMFDDSKLTALLYMDDYCDRLDDIFGTSWSLSIELLTSEDGCYANCTLDNYPCCGSWTLCDKRREYAGRNDIVERIYPIPVNVFRKMNEMVHLADMRVTVYAKG